MNIFTQVSIFLIFPLTIFSSPYTVTNYLDDITRQHHQKDILNQQRAIATEAYTQSMAVTDWKINTSLTNSRVEPTASSSFVANYIQSNTVQFGIDRSLLATGGRFGFNFSHQRVQQPEVNFNGIQFNQPLFHTASFGIQFTQPLLFGFGGEIPKQAIRIASANAHQANLQTKDQFETFIYQELVNFVDWTLANEVTELSFSRFQLAREAYKQTKDRVQVNLSEKIDLLRAEYALENAQQFWQSQNARLKAIQSKNASRLNQQSIRQVTPQFNLYETAYLKRPDYIVVKNLRIISSTSKQKDVLKHQLSLNQSQRNGNLTFTGSYDFLNGSNQFIDSQKLHNNNVAFSLNYQRSLSDTFTQSKVSEATLLLQQFELQESQRIRDVTAEIISLYTLIEEYKTQLDSTLNQIIISQRKAAAENDLYKQGRSSLDMLIQAQDNVLSSKLNYARLSADYQKSVLLYQSITDVLIKEYGVEI